MKLMRRKAFEIRGLPEPPLERPAPPKLLPIRDAAAISWQGSVGAENYTVERAANQSGPWAIAGEKIDETAVQYRPLFADARAKKGAWFYRVRAVNAAGASDPSNVVGPVDVKYATLVDEMKSSEASFIPLGELDLRSRDCRRFKEDVSRLAGGEGSALIYKLPARIRACRLYAFFPREIADFRFAVSAKEDYYGNDKEDLEVPCTKQIYYSGAGDYGYWKPVLFMCKPDAPDARFLKIQFPAEAQISRIEIDYDFPE